MNDVVALVDAEEHRRPVLVVAAAGARLLGCRGRQVATGEGAGRDDVVAVAREALADDDVDALVVAGTGSGAPAWSIIGEASKPVFVVPDGARLPMGRFERLLLPLDGDDATTAAVAAVLGRLAPGTTLVAAHVFGRATAPAFWDQAAHAGQAWEDEFLARHVPASTSLQVRRGEAPDEVLAESERCRADLVLLGWSRRLGGDRAQTVRRVLHGRVPVLLSATRRRV